jgi:hypothetical protein
MSGVVRDDRFLRRVDRAGLDLDPDRPRADGNRTRRLGRVPALARPRGLGDGAADPPRADARQGQILLFGGLSVAFAVVASRRTKAGANALNQGARGLVGRDYVLVAPIVSGEGHIRVNDTLWRVAGADAPLGARVRVTGVEGTLLTVVAA